MKKCEINNNKNCPALDNEGNCKWNLTKIECVYY